MKFKRIGPALGALAVATLLLSACGSDNKPTAAAAARKASSPNVGCGGKPTLTAAGSTAQDNAMTRFVKAFEQACPGQSLNYTANGSGAGISEFVGGQTDFGSSDSPLSRDEYAKAEQRCGSPVWNLPMVFGPIAIAYNVTGLTSLNLDGATAAKIFNGAITSWNDPAIAVLNPGASLPAEPIHVVFRSDDSGTTENFQRYLDTASGDEWGKGAAKEFKGGVGEGANGSNGAAAAVKGADGSITYVEWSFAQAQQLNVAKVITSAGPEPVALGTDSVGRTISSAWFTREGNDLALDTISFYRPNQAGAYPIVLATYEIVCSKYPDAGVGTAVRAFLQSTMGAGQGGLADNGYVAVPDAFRSRLAAAVNAIS
ncbi:phosphate ABC transporter substrate-binding protein PstS [Mycobacterium szulgai]|uniref:Phosphate-binding protein n=1 Tax=Mycobacterium szulgai TaxID=1787 RepID=A0A1X2EBT9_MYCSZ|nr:phosphate ABC transporter substrate-binding protein PstS [Mycobacterium szulgai]MCV7077809.1 phosphate ABC transporter substrate-binding protein PstS [Mycobacterium szulgai]ORW97873.1 phosphate-binding protein [Mycobacterium szulgai]